MPPLLKLQHDYDTIPGTTVFDGRLAMKGYALNKMCYSFNSAENREAYRKDPDAYCDLFQLNLDQRKALQRQNVAELIEAGANIYYLAKWAGIFGITVQQIGAQERGISEDAFKEMLLRAAEI
jgi:protocatechuate 4,5-dioxygenase alpha chain